MDRKVCRRIILYIHNYGQLFLLPSASPLRHIVRGRGKRPPTPFSGLELLACWTPLDYTPLYTLYTCVHTLVPTHPATAVLHGSLHP